MTWHRVSSSFGSLSSLAGDDVAAVRVSLAGDVARAGRSWAACFGVDVAGSGASLGAVIGGDVAGSRALRGVVGRRRRG